MDRSLAVRAAALYAPTVILALACSLRPPGKTRAVAAFLACGWCVPSLFFANVLSMHFGWWSFAPGAASIAGVPADLLFGWVVLWGAIPLIVLPNASIPHVVLALGVLDVIVMPQMAPVVQLGDQWLLGECVAIALALIPSQLLARWTLRNERTELRAAMQATAFSALLLWMLPELIFVHTSANWMHLRQTWNAFGGAHLQLAMLPALVGISAVQEFAQRGGGTPIPFDPPRRLVTSGPYAYVSNPMQLSMAITLTLWGLLIGSWWMALAGPMAFAYGIGLAAWDETSDLDARFGQRWHDYQQYVRAWIPRVRPYHPSVDRARDAQHTPAAAKPAVLYVAAGCGPCSEVAGWFGVRAPRGLVIMPAELHPARDLQRITYDPRDGSPDEAGVAAIARALEHIHLGWAMLGWTLRLPVLRPLLQLIVDASGGEPRVVPRASMLTPGSSASPECSLR